MRSWYGVIQSDAPDTITVHDRSSSFVAGSIQRSQSPAKARIGEPSAAVNRWGCFSPFSPVHSKNPLAGMMQRRRLKESRNIGFSAIVSAPALNVAGPSFRVLFPKVRHQAPAHRDQLAPALAIEPDHVDDGRRRDVVVRAQIARRAKHLQEHIDFLPGVILREASAHRGPCPPLHPQKFVPHRRVTRRYEFPPQLPGMPFAGGAETDRAASIAGVELIERAHATDRAR